VGSTLKGKSAIVTGATSGIGNAIASAFAEEGCNIMFNGFGDSEEIEAFRGNLSDRHDVDVFYDKCDLTDLAQISAMIANALERFGRIDILVNNAGIQHVSPIDEFPTEMFQRIIETNLAAPFYTIRGVLPIMKKNGIEIYLIFRAMFSNSALTMLSGLSHGRYSIKSNLTGMHPSGTDTFHVIFRPIAVPAIVALWSERVVLPALHKMSLTAPAIGAF